jgi:hypothetical protein
MGKKHELKSNYSKEWSSSLNYLPPCDSKFGHRKLNDLSQGPRPYTPWNVQTLHPNDKYLPIWIIFHHGYPSSSISIEASVIMQTEMSTPLQQNPGKQRSGQCSVMTEQHSGPERRGTRGQRHWSSKRRFSCSNISELFWLVYALKKRIFL